MDLRVPVFLGEIPFVFVKYREIGGRQQHAAEPDGAKRVAGGHGLLDTRAIMKRSKHPRRRTTRETPAIAASVPTFAETTWLRLSPGERLRRAWRLRRRLIDPQRTHADKLFPRLDEAVPELAHRLRPAAE